MKSINSQQYNEVVNDILNYSITQLQNKYSHEIKYLYSVLNDLSLGSGSPNYKIINKIATQQHIPFEFIVNTANNLILKIGEDNRLNYYEVLNIDSTASVDDIRDSWLTLVKQNHPDLIGESGVEKTKELNEAYDILKDNEKRNEYDLNVFDYYPLKVEYDGTSRFFNRKYLMVYSLVLVVAVSFLLKGYFENFINEDPKANLATRQLEYFEEVNKEKSELKYNKDVEELYSDFDKAKDTKSKPITENQIVKKQNASEKIPSEIPAKKELTDTDNEVLTEKDSFSLNKESIPSEEIEANKNSKNQKVEEYDPLLNSLIKKYGSKNRKNKKKENSIEDNKQESKKLLKTAKPVNKKKTKQEPLPVKNISTDSSSSNDSDVIVKNESPSVASLAPVNNQPTSTSLFIFVSDYVSAYKNRDFNKIKDLFMPDASENNMDVDQALAMYKSNFQKHKILRYDIQIKNKTVKGDNAFVNGQFVVIYKNNDNDKVNTRKGGISWKLRWIEEEWKINSLNYKFDKKDNYL